MRLLDSLGTTDALAEIFSDRSLIDGMLRFEAALARAESAAGIVPAEAANAIAAAATPDAFDAAAIAAGARASGTVAIPLLDQLRARVGARVKDAVPFVHRGATSQDVTDTALILCLVRASRVLAADHERLSASLRRLSDDHAETVMLARTLLQPAAPITFGLKVAGWFGAVSRAGARVFEAFEDARVLQFGGAAGTLAALGPHGPEVAAALARELHLRDPQAPWHVHRDRLAALAAACGVYTGALGKIARDISLLMQDEVAEASEPGGGSSTMPHKRNPAKCAIALAAAGRVPSLVATCLAAMPQEHERGLGTWHAEGPTVAAVVQATGAALSAMTDAVGDLHVDAARMRERIDATGGSIFAEQAMMLLAPAIGRDAAVAAIGAALETSRTTETGFVEALLANAALRDALTPAQRQALGSPEDYLGSAERFRRSLLDPSQPSSRR